MTAGDRSPRLDAPSSRRRAPRTKSGWRPLVLLLLLSLALAAASGWLFWREMRDHLEDARVQLELRADLKARELAFWLKQRAQSALSYRRARFFQEDLPEILRGGRAARDRVENRLEEIRVAVDVDAILVLDSAGRTLLATGSMRGVSAELRRDVAEVARTLKPRLHALRHIEDAGSAPVVLDQIVPVEVDPPAATAPAVLVLRDDAARTLFPIVQNWPVTSRTGEAYLARRAGNRVEYLSGLKFKPGAALTAGPAVAGGERALAQLARGARFVEQAVDYRGIPVLAAARETPGSGWQVVAKIDLDEVMEPVNERAWRFLTFLLGLTLLAGVGATRLWRQQTQLAGLRERALAAEREALEKHLDLLSRHANDIILLLDREGRIVQANDRAIERYQYPRGELIGMPAARLRSALEPSELADRLGEIWRSGSGSHESLHVTRTGNPFPVEMTGHLVESGGGRYIQAIIRDISERKQAEELLRQSEARYRALVEQSLAGIYIVQGDRFRYVNPRFAEIFGCGSPDEIIDRIPVRELVAPQDRARVAENLRRRLEGEIAALHYGFAGLRRDGARIDVEVHGRSFLYQGRPAVIGLILEVTERKQNEARIARLSQLRNALSDINRAIVHATGEDALFAEICAIAVRHAGFVLAWIGVPDRESGAVLALTSAGAITALDYPNRIRLSHHDVPEGRGPVGTAIREKRTVVANDLLGESRYALLHEAARNAGVRASAALPLLRNGEVAAVLLVCSATAGYFDAEIVDLLEEMAQDVSFSLEVLQRDRERKRAEESLRESEARFRAVLEQSIAAVYVIHDGRIVYVNPRMREICGYRPEEPFDPDPLAHIQEAERPRIAGMMQRRMGDEPEAAYSVKALHKDGTPFTLGVHAKQATFEGKPAIIAIAQDITDKARAEEAIKRYVTRLEQAMQSTINVVATIGELRDPYTHGHERRVGEIAAAIAAEMGLDANRVEGIRIAGYLHDVGKIGVPAEILAKPSRLTRAEFDLVKDHAQQSYEILKTVEFPWPIAEAAWQHHERLDGSGYPRGLKGGDIIPEARILAVADVTEAMSSHRPYRPGLGVEKALAELEEGRGKIYDEPAVDACLRLFREKGYTLPA